MEKDLNSWGLVLQSNTSSSSPVKDGKLSLTLNRKKFTFQIDDPDDQKKVYRLMNDLLGEDAEPASLSACEYHRNDFSLSHNDFTSGLFTFTFLLFRLPLRSS